MFGTAQLIVTGHKSILDPKVAYRGYQQPVTDNA